MFIKGSDVVGLPVICVDNGCKSLDIKDIVFCNQNLQVLALLVDEGGFFHGAKVIPFSRIMHIGQNMITIESSNCIETADHALDNVHMTNTRGSLIGHDVISEIGNSVGSLRDIVFDKHSGKIVGVILTEGLFSDFLVGRPIVPVSEYIDLKRETIIISKSQSDQIIYNTGGLKKLLALE
ncbi:MAG: PRC-barrel domain-containing protein [Bacillota bacterium]